MKHCVIIALICVALAGELARAARLSSAQEWTLFKSKHGKSYEDPAEEARRFANFMATKQRVERHNAQGNSSFRMGLNHLADWTQEELAMLNGVKVDESVLIQAQEKMDETEAYLAEILGSSDDPVPSEFDWRKVPGRVTAIKNQGQCGSCWAFASVGVLEGQEIGRVSNKASEVVLLSEQELVDCSKSNFGCGGGYMSKAFDDLKKLGGIESGEDYPYVEKNGTCKFNKTEVVMKEAGGVILPAKDEAKLKEVLVKYGPISVAMDATCAFQLYHSGVFIDDTCGDKVTEINHAVLLVGYGTDPKQGDYWIVKNSWGTDWGENGFFRITRGGNICAIATLPTIAKF